jgi:hypothetical protein
LNSAPQQPQGERRKGKRKERKKGRKRRAVQGKEKARKKGGKGLLPSSLSLLFEFFNFF